MLDRLRKTFASRLLGASLAFGLLQGGAALADVHAPAPAVHAPAIQAPAAHAPAPAIAPHAPAVPAHAPVVPAPPAHAPALPAGGAVHAPAAQGPHVLSAQDAAKMAGTRIFYGTLSSTPQDLAREIKLAAGAGDKHVEGFYMGTMLPKEHFEPNPKYKHNLFFVSANSREAASNGSANRVRDDLHNLGKRIEAGEFDFDTVVVRVSPPNAEGLVSLGTTGDLTVLAVKQVLAKGGRVIAQVNPNVPFTHGSNTMPYAKLTAIVHSNEPIPALLQEIPTSVEKTIADNVAKLIPNRARSTLQVGIGAALGDIGRAVKDKKLRIWSEMGSDWLIDTVASEKPAAHEATVSFLHGSNLLYQVAHDNPAIKVESSTLVNDPKMIAQQKRMVAVNTALEIDIAGNTNGEEVEGRVISSPGGQPNFMKGASLAPDGKAVLAIRSVNKYGASTIVQKLSSQNVTTPSDNVDHVVTEWGVTDRLRGVPTVERTYQILSVAHPFHRETLGKQALAQKKITQQQYDKLVRSVSSGLLRAPLGMRAALAIAARDGMLITPEQYDAIARSIPPGTPPDLVPVPAIAAR